MVFGVFKNSIGPSDETLLAMYLVVSQTQRPAMMPMNTKTSISKKRKTETALGSANLVDTSAHLTLISAALATTTR